MRVFVSAGEASGDAYGAALLAELKAIAGPQSLETWAIGGPRLRAEADRLIADSSSWSAISVAQSIRVVPRVLAGSAAIPRLLREAPGGLLVPIDFGFYNVRLARRAKAAGWKVLSFVPPGSWRRDRQGAWIPAVSDAVSTPFPWSADLLRAMGAPEVHWFGHPLKQLLRDRLAAAPATERREQLAGLPGSRAHELAQTLPLIAALDPPLPIEFALPAGHDPARFLSRWKALAPRRADSATAGASPEVLLRSRAAIVCSGTATLEAALCRCPTMVVYPVSRLMLFEAWLGRIERPKFVALPNIILDRAVVGEFVGREARVEPCRAYLAELLAGGAVCLAQLAAFDELREALGPDDAITQTARLAMRLMS